MATYYSGRASGPQTRAGKAVSARNATTHGLFCRQTVLPYLGESPEAYKQLLQGLFDELRPRNLMERQYLELWAEASWKLRRLSRWEPQLWEDDALEEDVRLQKMKRVSRLQNTLRRQLDKAVRMLTRDVSSLYGQRTREDVLAQMNFTESQCEQETYRAREVERAVQQNRHLPSLPEDFDRTALDNAASGMDESEDRRGEVPSPGPGSVPLPAEASEPAQNDLVKFCQNELSPCEPAPEPARTPPPLPLGPPLLGAGGPPAPPEPGAGGQSRGSSRRAERRERLQCLEDLLNSGTLTRDERQQILMGGEINAYTLSSEGVKIEK